MQADIKTISSLGGYAVSAITSITAQNTIGIQDFYDIPPEIVAGQIDAIVNDVQPKVVKVGMLRNPDTLDRVAAALGKYSPLKVIYDPVIVSSRGDTLMPRNVMERMKSRLLPLCTLVTVNKTNAERLLGVGLDSRQDLLEAAKETLGYGSEAVLLRGGASLAGSSTDILMMRDAAEPVFLSSPETARQAEERHGTSGNLSSAIAFFMCREHGIPDAVTLAYNYMNQALASAMDLVGRGSELYNEFVNEVAARHKTNKDVRFYADRLNVSSSYLAQVTKRVSGLAPKMIIDDCLIREAEIALASSDKTIQEIAYDFGFNSQAHFSRFFRKMAGETPSEYRKNKRKTL